MNEKMLERIYRQHRNQLYTWICLFVIFFAMTLCTVSMAYWNTDGSFPNPKLHALVHGVFWSGWTILCVWGILSYYRESLIISEKTITKFCVVRKKLIAIEELSGIKWPRHVNVKAIVLESSSAKIGIYLSEYTKQEQDAIVEFLHKTVADENQKNWSEFQAKYYRDVVKITATPTTAKELLLTTFILLILAGCFIYFWWIGIGVKNLVFGVITLMIAGWFLSRLGCLPTKTQGNVE